MTLRSIAGAGGGLVAFLHYNALALILAQLELDNRRGFGRRLIGCLHVAQVVRAVAEDGDTPRPQLGGASLMAVGCSGGRRQSAATGKKPRRALTLNRLTVPTAKPGDS
jgi:hypothetical protein